MRIRKDVDIKSELYDKKATVYLDEAVQQRAALLYFHGGGLLFGNRDDLPETHLKAFCTSGYPVIAFDYPLAPAAKLDQILDDCISSINFYLKNRDRFLDREIPYFLFGRSAGAYLALLAGRRTFSEAPRGLLSYYGYGLLCDQWYRTPSDYYLRLPKVTESCLNAIPDSPHADGNFETHYAAYVYARQSGRWPQLFYGGREKFLLADYSLRLCEKYPCRLFCAHSSNDTDVPFKEFSALCEKFSVRDKLVVTDKMHDFDKMEHSSSTERLLNKSLEFIKKSL
jgi:acetyl esterase/lipase